MRMSGPEMDLAHRTLLRVDELTRSLPISINHKTLFVAGDADAPWASFAVSHATIKHGIFAASFDLTADVEVTAQGLAELILARWASREDEERAADIG